MTSALTVYGQFETLQRAAVALFESRYFSDATSKAQAIVKVMAGAELGLPPFASMAGINIQGGKPVLGGNLIATLIKNDPRYDYKIQRLDNEACEIVFFENNQPVGVSTFTIKDANTAKVWSKKANGFIPLTQHNQNWQSYPRNMLFNRTISNGAKWYCPGVFGGSPVYTPEELGMETDENGDAVEGIVVDHQLTSRDDYEDVPTVDQSLFDFAPGDDVLVAGKNDEKPGTVVRIDGTLVVVNVDGKEYSMKPERLTLVDIAPAQQPLFEEEGPSIEDGEMDAVWPAGRK